MQEEVNRRKSLYITDINEMNLIIDYLNKYRKGTQLNLTHLHDENTEKHE